METEKKKKRGNKRSREFNPNEDELSVIEALIQFREIHNKIQSKQAQFLNCYSPSTTFTTWGIKRRRSVVENPPLPQSQPRSPTISPVPIPPVIEKESKITSPVSPLVFSTCPGGGGDSNQKSKSLPLPLTRSSPPSDKQGRREREKSKRFSKTKKKELENVDIELTKENAWLRKSIQEKIGETHQLKVENSMLKNRKNKLLLFRSSEKEPKENGQSPAVKKKGKEHAKPELETWGGKVSNNGTCSQLSALQALQEEEEQLLGRYYHDYEQKQLLGRYYDIYEQKQQHYQQEEKKFEKCNGKGPRKENSSEKDEQSKQGAAAGVIDLNQLPDDNDEEGENIPSSSVTSDNVDLRMSSDIDKRSGTDGLFSLDAVEKVKMEEERMRAVSIQAACKANREERMRRNREKKKMKVARPQPVVNLVIAKQ